MSCLFNSLSRFVKDDRIDGAVLRKLICDYLETNPMIFDDMTAETTIKEENGLDIATYVSNMRNSGTFGGAIEIRSFTKIFKLNVLVRSLPNSKNIEFIENTDCLWAYITWNGGHFEAVEN